MRAGGEKRSQAKGYNHSEEADRAHVISFSHNGDTSSMSPVNVTRWRLCKWRVMKMLILVCSSAHRERLGKNASETTEVPKDR